jgi:hypothetical protein
MGKSTLEHCSNFLFFFNITGILPIQIVYRKGSGGSKTFSGVEVENRRRILAIHFIIKIYLTLRAALIIFQLFQTDLRGPFSKVRILFPAIGIIGLIVVTIGIILPLHRQKNQIANFFYEWRLLELRILKQGQL